MRNALLLLPLVGLALALPTVPPAHAAAGIARCDGAALLQREDFDDLAKKQYEKGLNEPTQRACAVIGLKAIRAKEQEAATQATPSSTCTAGDDLLRDGLPDEAKGQYEKALEDDKTRTCGVTGLKAVDDDANETTPEEVADAVAGWAKTIWPWPLALLVLWPPAFLYRLVRPGGLRVVPAEGDKDLATLLVEAANATGTGGRPPAKLVVAEEQGLDEKTVPSVTKLLGIPGAAPIDALLNIAWFPWRAQRLKVGYSEGGGWAVLDLRLHRVMRSQRHARLAIQLEHEETKVRQEVLSLVAGAWLAGIYQAGSDDSPVAPDDWEAVVAHAYFRAGANLQDRAQPGKALACYAAMPALEDEDGRPDPGRAPTAWIGARLNLMLMLKGQGRVREALALAKVAGEAADAVLLDADTRAYYGARAMDDLRRRAKYLISVVYEDLVCEDPVPGGPTEDEAKALADAAAADLADQIRDLEAAEPTHWLLRPMCLVQLCHELRAAPGTVAEANVRGVLTDRLADAARESTSPPVVPAAYYDAACVLALMPDPTDDRRAEALRYLRLAVRSSSKDSQPRVRKMARADPMLAKLRPSGVGSREKYDQDLADALGKDDEKAG